MLSHTTEIRVRYAETDRMGFAYHGHYLTWFEVARVQLLDAFDCPYRDLEAEGYFLPVLRAEVKYRIPLTFDDRVALTVEMKEKPGLRIFLQYTVRRDGKITASGLTEHAFIDRKGRPQRPPEKFLHAIEKAWTETPPGRLEPKE